MDVASAYEAATYMVVSAIFTHERIERIVLQHSMNASFPGLQDIMRNATEQIIYAPFTALLSSSTTSSAPEDTGIFNAAYAAARDTYLEIVSASSVLVNQYLTLAQHASSLATPLSPIARSVVEGHLSELGNRLRSMKDSAPEYGDIWSYLAMVTSAIGGKAPFMKMPSLPKGPPI
jgi:hypothetical protein